MSLARGGTAVQLSAVAGVGVGDVEMRTGVLSNSALGIGRSASRRGSYMEAMKDDVSEGSDKKKGK